MRLFLRTGVGDTDLTLMPAGIDFFGVGLCSVQIAKVISKLNPLIQIMNEFVQKLSNFFKKHLVYKHDKIFVMGHTMGLVE